ncbi:MAG: bifunctional diaminohydroxyphosphoribosylaminopyrimidine deaminase/5-amino-6-(5-phosphoribosylamino)uracil reductase RibD [Corynebacterium sp.]|nr:bifunctional diaminohydroxyphosphoribosylaminopyrimidine deaminase/5-amino-6-(5-phosphoribosylamino)uracil reductase RibD [Corynebacterium sp.]
MEYTQALELAIAASVDVMGTTSPNPPVGAVILDINGQVAGVGATEPVGGAHAEIVALRRAGLRAAGGTAVVTLEPCNHTGRTGPCAKALVDAGIKRVVYVHEDPYPIAAGGAEYLRAHGVDVSKLDANVEPLEPWLHSVTLGRPYVTWKTAHTLDGFTAAIDGSSQWITGVAAREYAHRDRSTRDAIIVGTGTVLADQPQLTARKPDGSLYAHQPRRVVVGTRDVPGDFVQYASPRECLDELWKLGARNVLVEGGAELATSFMQQGLVDAIHAYIAPAVLGAGRGVLTSAIAASIDQARRYELRSVTQLGNDILLKLGT